MSKTYCDFKSCIKFKECEYALPEKLKDQKVSKLIKQPNCYNIIMKSIKVEKFNYKVNDTKF